MSTKLTAQQERFCQAVADGMTQADAYRSAYKACGKSASALHVDACKAAAVPKVALRIKELREALSEKALWTREQAVQALIAEAGGDRAGDRINALKALNDMHGYNAPTKVDVRGSISINVNFD